MGREAFDREHKCKTGVKDICEGETERVNEHGVRQCQPCATFIADQQRRTHLWDPHSLRVPWKFLPNKKRKPDVAKSVDWAEVDQRIDDDLKYVRWADKECTPHECDDDCIINYKHLRESLDLILTAHHPDIRDEVMGMWGDAVGNNADAHLRFNCRTTYTYCLKELGEEYWLGSYTPPFKSHAEVMAECDCPKCVADGEE
jgi:hypothetical protein